MGTCQVTLSYRPSELSKVEGMTASAGQRNQQEQVNSEVIQKIAQGFVDLDLDDPVNRGLSAVMDSLFYGKNPREISKSHFTSFVLEKLKCGLTEKDLIMFYIANPVMQQCNRDMINQD
jgi:hypothetical protein